MYEKNGSVTSPVVDANKVSIGTRKTLLSRKEVNVETIFSFVRRCLQAFFLSEVVRSLYNWERLFRSERELHSCRGWTESLVDDDRNPTKPLTRCWTSRCSTAALFRSSLAFCESSRRNLRQRPTGEEAAQTHHPRVNLCRRRSLAGKTAVGDAGLGAIPAGTMRWTVRKLADDSASEVSQWTPSRPVVVVVVIVVVVVVGHHRKQPRELQW